MFHSLVEDEDAAAAAGAASVSRVTAAVSATATATTATGTTGSSLVSGAIGSGCEIAGPTTSTEVCTASTTGEQQGRTTGSSIQVTSARAATTAADVAASACPAGRSREVVASTTAATGNAVTSSTGTCGPTAGGTVPGTAVSDANYTRDVKWGGTGTANLGAAAVVQPTCSTTSAT